MIMKAADTNKVLKAYRAFLARATVKNHGQLRAYAYDPDETPNEVKVFLKGLSINQLHNAP